MKHIFIISLALLLGWESYAQKIEVTSELKGQLDEYISYLESENQIVGTVSVYQQGKEVYGRHMGQETLSKNYNPKELVYQMGSISKLFTAVLFGVLEEKGRISFDQTVDKYFPDLPNADKITLTHMLNHTSGLGDFVMSADSNYQWLIEPVAEKEILELIHNRGVSFEPEEEVRYSNSAYYLLVKILEKEYGKEFHEVLEEEITSKLGLEKIVSLTEDSQLTNVAPSFNKETGQEGKSSWKEITEFYFPNVSGVGDMVSDAGELNEFVTDLFHGKIIRKETLDKMLPTADQDFGLGIMRVPFYDRIWYGHGGDTYGTHSVMAYDPDNDMAITYLINGESYPTNSFAIDFLSILYGEEYERPVFGGVVISEQELKRFQGDYSSDEMPLEISIFMEEGVLKAQGTGQPSFPLTAVSEMKFVFHAAGIELEFEPKNDEMILNQGGQQFKFKRQG